MNTSTDHSRIQLKQIEYRRLLPIKGLKLLPNETLDILLYAIENREYAKALRKEGCRDQDTLLDIQLAYRRARSALKAVRVGDYLNYNKHWYI